MLSPADIVHLAEGPVLPPPQPTRVLDIKEDEAEYRIEARQSRIKSIDASIYQKAVEAALRPLFDANPVLIKIRQGEPVSNDELEQLNSLVHTHNPDVDLHALAEFYRYRRPRANPARHYRYGRCCGRRATCALRKNTR